MGNTIGSTKNEAVLLQPSMNGDMDKVKELVGVFLASYSTSNVGHVSIDPKLQAFVDRQDKDGNNAIHGAVFGGHLDIVKYLVEGCGASLTLTNNLGCTALWLAAGYNRIDVMKYLLTKSGAATDLLSTNSSGDTPLIAAASRGYIEPCQLLLQRAKDNQEDPVNILVDKIMTTTNNNGDTPLHVAIASAQTNDELLDFLLQHTPDVNACNKIGLTPILVACERDDVKLLQKLVDHNANVMVRDSHGASPLAVAAFCGSKEVIPILLQYSNDLLEEPNTNGCTPLWLAARSGRPEVVQLLLDAGADPTIANKEGISPIDVASKHKRTSVEVLFKKQSS